MPTLKSNGLTIEFHALTRGERLFKRTPMWRKWVKLPKGVKETDDESNMRAEKWNFICVSVQGKVLSGKFELTDLTDDDETFERKFQGWLGLEDTFSTRMIAVLNELNMDGDEQNAEQDADAKKN